MMKKLLFLLLFCASGAYAQSIKYQLSPPAPNAQVLVCPSPDAGYPCPVQQAIFSDVGLTVPINQPVSLGSSGFFSFYVAAGTYTIQLTGPGYNSSNRQIVPIGGGGGGGISFVSSLPATCTPGVTANVALSVSPYGQFYCSATNVWSPGPSGLTAGIFTVAQDNEFFAFTVGTGACPYSTIIGPGKITDGLSGCVVIPTSGVTNGFSNGVAGYAINANANSTGQFGKVQAVGVYGAAACTANNTKCEGISPQVYDSGGLTGTVLVGQEIGVSPGNTTTTGYGGLYSFESGTVQPAGDQMPAIVIQTPASTGTWTSGFECQDGSTSTHNCVDIGKIVTGNGQNSQNINFRATALGGTNFTGAINLNQDNLFAVLSTRALGVLNPTTDESFPIALTATVTLPQFTLVKIDTAHADSVVVCTTADTQCHGFVIGTNGTNGLCAVGVTYCPIATAPGSKVVGVVGTGTCAIGNNVIVDTTTNGRVKCQAGVPAQGAWVGIALSVQGSVGGNVDILTKFQ